MPDYANDYIETHWDELLPDHADEDAWKDAEEGLKAWVRFEARQVRVMGRGELLTARLTMSRTAIGERIECAFINDQRDCHTIKFEIGRPINFTTEVVGAPDATSCLIALTALTIELGIRVTLG